MGIPLAAPRATHWKQSGGPQGMGLRTLSALPCIVGVVRDSWSQGCFSVYPLRQSWANTPTGTPLMKSCPAGKHIIHLGRNWSDALKTGLVGSSTEIANLCGLTSGRVRQIVRLAGIDQGIVEFLAELDGRTALKGYSEKRIRFIAALPHAEQMERFEREFGVRLPG